MEGWDRQRFPATERRRELFLSTRPRPLPPDTSQRDLAAGQQRLDDLTVRRAGGPAGGQEVLGRRPGGRRRTQPLGRCPARIHGAAGVACRPGRSDRLLDIEPAARHPVADLVRCAKRRWRVEHDYRELKHGLGLDHFEGRTWRG
ncbi:transposase [Streptomyces sp. NPDC048157]|uniref:transposase n=1 Tax=Streptomyces sp. NPDC048157 TaxID=3365503 RepID=UPI003719B315